MFSRYFSKFSRLSATIFLIVFNGFVNSAGYSTIGEGRHTIENGTVTLANGSRIATREDVDEYQNQPRACNVEIDAEGNIILNFDWFTNTAYEGCTVDLVTEIGGDKETNVVEFTVSFDHYGESELNTCMSCGGMSGNIIPFVFNIDSNEFDELVQMPPNEWPCQQPWNKLWSSSEIRICYSGDEIQIGSFIDTPEFLNFWFWCHRDENRTFENLKQLEFNVEINGETFVVNHTDYNFSRCRSESFAKPLCSPVKPKVWPIVGNAKLEGKGLLAFSLLPRYQIIFRRGCHFVSLKFPGKKYSLLTTLPPLPPKPLTTMNGTTIDEIITLFKNNGDFEYESSTSDLSQNLTNQLNSSSIQTNKTSIIAKINGTTMFSTLTNGTLTGGNLTNEQTTPTEETTINETYSGTPQIIPAIVVTTTEATTTEETTLEPTTIPSDETPTQDEETTYEVTTEETTEYPTEETSIPTTSTTTTIVTSSEMTTTFIDPTTTTSASPTEEETTSTSQMVLPPLKTSENLPEITTPTTTEAIKTTQQEALTATKSSSKIWIFIVVVVLLICLSVGGVFYYLNYMKKEEHSVEEGVKREDRSNEEVDKTERETEEDSMKILKDKKKHPRFDETQRETKRETTIKQLFDKTQRSESEEKSLKEEEKLDATSKTVSEEEVTIENKTLLSVYGPSQFGNGSKLKEAKVEEEKSKKEEKVKQKVEEGKTTKEVEQKVEDKDNNKNSNVAL
uniref:Uncharacterized protein n=1 Tax=Meloidogyne enterolobii TaxID=390850 RepID=A0A6V7X3S1_MELEN|nr:unnamed protein product [Meloidogyne enterolobii]